MSRSSGTFDVDLLFCQLSQQCIRVLLFHQGLVEQVGSIVQAGELGSAPQSTISGDLIVLNCLGDGNQARIESRTSGELVHDFLAFGQNAENRLAGNTFGPLAQ